jgi:1-acyl-sn-glycerol-3-phosphate acyltransferase
MSSETESPPAAGPWTGSVSGRQPFARRLIKAVLGPYAHAWHALELEGRDNLPPHGPALFLLNHASLLDVPMLMVVDPYPDTVTLVKASLFKVPIVRFALRQWGAIPIDRRGRDLAAIRLLMGHLRAGRVVAVAAEGRRTRTGHLGPINPVLTRIAIGADVPLIPIGIVGSFEALPPGRVVPRRHKILVRVGPCFRLPRDIDAETGARRIRQEIAALLLTSQQPLD